MKIAIIGGAGFLGSSIAQLIRNEGGEVCIFDTKERLLKNYNFLKSYSTHLLPYPQVDQLHRHLAGYEILVHLACTTEPASSMKSFTFDAHTNIVPSVKIFKTAINVGIKRIIFSSSGGTVYGNPTNLPVHENDEKQPICAYGVSKLAIERYLDLYSRNSPMQGISLRPGNPYGLYQLKGTTIGIIANYLNAIKKGQAIEVWGDGNIVRDFLSIDCVASAFYHAIFSSDLPSGSYNIGSGKGTSINELISLLFDITGRRAPVNYKPGRFFDVSNIVLNSSRFQSLTSWRPKILLEEGISKMWGHMKQG